MSLLVMGLVMSVVCSGDMGPLFTRIQEEERLAQSCGRVVFRMELPEGQDWTREREGLCTMSKEAKTGAHIQFEWNGPKFRVEVINEDRAVIRTIVCDGDVIDAGDGQVWSAECLLECFNPDWPESDQFHELMWPYNWVAYHMYPLTARVGVCMTASTYSAIYEVCPAEEQQFSDDSALVSLDLRTRELAVPPKWRGLTTTWVKRLTFNPSTGFSVAGIEQHGEGHVYDHGTFGPAVLVGEHWIASTHSSPVASLQAGESDKSRIITTLCVEKSSIGQTSPHVFRFEVEAREKTRPIRPPREEEPSLWESLTDWFDNL